MTRTTHTNQRTRPRAVLIWGLVAGTVGAVTVLIPLAAATAGTIVRPAAAPTTISETPYDDSGFSTDAPYVDPELTSGPPPNGVLGQPYSFFFTATGNPPAIFTVDDENLPDGLALNSITGELSGTPTKLQTTTFRIAVFNSTVGGSNRTFTMSVVEAAPETSAPPAPTGSTGQPSTGTTAGSPGSLANTGLAFTPTLISASAAIALGLSAVFGRIRARRTAR
jgi:hypothetical protein